MKKSIITTILISTFFCCSMSSQRNLYLDVGYNSSKISTNIISTAARPGYYAGLYFSDSYSKHLELTSSIIYTKLGTTTNNYTEDYHYLEGIFSAGTRVVPEMLIHGGFSIAKLLESDKILVKRSLDYGLNVGVAYDFGNYLLHASYYRGLQNQSLGDNDISYNTNLKFGIGLKLGGFTKKVTSDTTLLVLPQPILDTIEIPEIIDTTPYYRHHVGLSMYSFTGFDMIYKRALSPNRFLRLNLLTSKLLVQSSDNDLEFDAAIGLNIGLEWQKSIDDNTYLAHGPRLGGFINVHQNSDYKLSLGYYLGIYHSFNKRFDIGLEVGTAIDYAITEDTPNQIGFNLGNQRAALVIAYKIVKK